ncbi:MULTISPECIES: DUF6165 family protein [Halobacteriovorax]|uniref:Uncharacterized protein n=1 Tax=Halobacteriovorax vibrionivorans TaxID=2152716 RepID=A0ABY0IFR5_9BACT|nr:MULTISPECIES: DUF6165 family protein [Halobacteriovorax]AYF43638.1 hypothetical protein BALOs_0627 [Halobacteriovorax sp. BALOs_7]RZF21797.1 hypothetical protein DAY19_08900 [Halobacteriovorax vibrionivorans]TGD48368.1 hypothetical protein EP118_04395 [Halobacteriovorax sp. Y22]
MIIECPVSLGELVDKMTILKIKTERIEDPERVKLAQQEYDQLAKRLNELNLEGLDKYMSELKEINEKLWVIEDDIRIKEKEGDFGEGFISLARSVYVTNDLRFKVKNSINMSYNSGIKEVKSYK